MNWLVVWDIFDFFHSILGIVTPADFHIFQRGGSTTNQWTSMQLDRLFHATGYRSSENPSDSSSVMVSEWHPQKWLAKDFNKNHPETPEKTVLKFTFFFSSPPVIKMYEMVIEMVIEMGKSSTISKLGWWFSHFNDHFGDSLPCFTEG